MNIRTGIIGAGDIGVDRHIPAFRNADGTTVSGVYDRNAEKTKRIATRHDITPARSVADLCAHSDLIVLCTPPWTHCELAVEALNHDRHVLTEKPIGMALDEADRMIAASEDSDGTLSVVNNFLYLSAVQRAQHRIDSGRYGDVRRVYAVQFRQFDHDEHDPEWFERLPGGMFWDESPHMIYLLRSFLGELSVDDARAEARAAPKQKQNIYARFQGGDGTSARLVMDFDSPITEWWLGVFCTEGVFLIDLFRDLLLYFDRESDHSPRQVLSVILRGIHQTVTGMLGSGSRLLYHRFVQGYGVPAAGLHQQAAAVVAALRAGQQPPVAAERGRQDLKVMSEVAERAGL